uniref:Uncharacterized protein n=2 Tax=unclassified Caudoviricetes TaxID=2788787 RepID=A0A8S5V3Y6_9CAUD|nr:MAG TPA: hypothetical protein [Podoviridae sp. ctoqT5]DAG01323.1 MAG TPA: hypothetical protein [Myoviridae sp. ctk6V34]
MLKKLVEAVSVINAITKEQDTYITVYSDYGETKVNISSKMFDTMFDDYTIEKREDGAFPYQKVKVCNGVKIYALYAEEELNPGELENEEV